MIDYKGKRVVVSGAASGIGAATARIAAELGAQVTGLDVKKANTAEFIEVNLMDRASIDAAVKRLGPSVDVLFNCAGVQGPPFSNLETMLVNFIGLRHLTESLLPRIGKGGAIVSVASLAGQGYQRNLKNLNEFLATPGFDEARAWCESHGDIANGYSFSKESVVAYTLMRAKDFGGRGVRINCTSPGITETPLLPRFEALVGKEWMETYLQGFLGRNAKAEEQAQPLLFLGSDAASYVSGANLFVDAGYSGALQTGQIQPPPRPTVRPVA